MTLSNNSTSVKSNHTREREVSLRRILTLWWPLAGSWLLISSEGLVHSAVVARLINAEVNLAAWGGIVFPVSLVIESPIIMLLSASTALSKDWPSYVTLRRFMLRMGAFLTLLHILVAFTPLYYFVVNTLLEVPSVIIEPARIGLMIMTPWTWAIAYRRFNQGVLIRFGHTKAVGRGTVIRLMSNGLVLAWGYIAQTIPGIIVASSAVATGVVVEALYVGFRVRPVLKTQVRVAPHTGTPLTFKRFLDFYVPLALTSLLWLLVQPIGSAALSRMPNALASLAVWPVVTGLLFVLRSPGVAYNEVVITLLDKKGAPHNLRRFATILLISTTLLLVLIVATPLDQLWFTGVSALPPHLADIAQRGLWFTLLLPALSVLQNWYQGTIVNSQRTRGITEAVILYLVVTVAIQGLGILWGRVTGLYIGLAAYSIATLTQTLWLWYRSRPALRAVYKRDQHMCIPQ